jgi:hypothetical protein
MVSEVTQAPPGTNKAAVGAAVAAVIALVLILAWTVFAVAIDHSTRLPEAVTLSVVVAVPVAALTGIVLGHVARSQTKRSGQRGRGLALVALIVSYLSALAYAAMVLLVILAIQVLIGGLAG